MHHLRISHETIYQHILNDKTKGGMLYRHLRLSNKKRRKRYGSHDRRVQIQGRVSIDERPAVVDARDRIGDWEIDTIMGKKHLGGLRTLIERRTQIHACQKAPHEIGQSSY